MVHTHDYLHCQDGDDCKDCKIHEQGERLRDLIRNVVPDQARKTKVLKALVKQMGLKK